MQASLVLLLHGVVISYGDNPTLTLLYTITGPGLHATGNTWKHKLHKRNVVTPSTRAVQLSTVIQYRALFCRPSNQQLLEQATVRSALQHSEIANESKISVGKPGKVPPLRFLGVHGSNAATGILKNENRSTAMKYCQVPPLPRPDMRYSSHINTLRSMEHR
jgi:hypothetical protein